MRTIGRREALGLGAAAMLSGFAQPALAAAEPRRALLHNLHTGERFSDVYFEGGRYVPEALARASEVLRDWRTGESHVMEPGLFDAMHAIRTRLDTTRPFAIISGYRSPATNAKLHARSAGVATRSLHMQGMALDLKVEGVALDHLHRAALDVAAGGVGYYPQSGFVHVDTGRVRRWTGA